jgi:hypothetical protein
VKKYLINFFLVCGLLKKKILMSKRTSPNQIQTITDLNNLDKIVVDKRNEKRADAKKGRRNRHYTKLLINQQVNLDTWREEDEN